MRREQATNNTDSQLCEGSGIDCGAGALKCYWNIDIIRSKIDIDGGGRG